MLPARLATQLAMSWAVLANDTEVHLAALTCECFFTPDARSQRLLRRSHTELRVAQQVSSTTHHARHPTQQHTKSYSFRPYCHHLSRFSWCASAWLPSHTTLQRSSNFGLILKQFLSIFCNFEIILEHCLSNFGAILKQIDTFRSIVKHSAKFPDPRPWISFL